MPNATQSVTWDELLESIATGAAHPDDTNWKIFRYLQNNYKTMGAVTARTLLAAYMKLHVKRMSLIDSCMLGMAVNISETYSDFKLPKFLEAWGYDQFLRPICEACSNEWFGTHCRQPSVSVSSLGDKRAHV